MQAKRVLKDWQVNISFFQIYIEQISDLLNPGGSKNLQIRQEQGEIYVEDLLECKVDSFE